MSVASFTDAWIETHEVFCGPHYNEVASFTDAWIETSFETGALLSLGVASFTDAWIETKDDSYYSWPRPRRIFYRCVD